MPGVECVMLNINAGYEENGDCMEGTVVGLTVSLGMYTGIQKALGG